MAAGLNFVVVSALCADLIEPQARRYTRFRHYPNGCLLATPVGVGSKTNLMVFATSRPGGGDWSQNNGRCW